MKKLVDSFIKQNDNVRDFLDKSEHDYSDADKVLPEFGDFLKQSNFNVALGLDFATLLQLSNDKRIFEQYQLGDIRRLFESLLNLEKSNLETYVDAAHFEFAVMDDAGRAKAIATQGVEIAKQKIEELQQLLDSINSE